MMRLKSIAMKVLLLTGTLVFMAIILEVGTRLLTDIIPPIQVRDALVGQRYISSFEDDVYVPEAGRKIRLRFNRVGFRGPDRPFEKPVGVRRVAVFNEQGNHLAARLVHRFLTQGDQHLAVW